MVFLWRTRLLISLRCIRKAYFTLKWTSKKLSTLFHGAIYPLFSRRWTLDQGGSDGLKIVFFPAFSLFLSTEVQRWIIKLSVVYVKGTLYLYSFSSKLLRALHGFSRMSLTKRWFILSKSPNLHVDLLWKKKIGSAFGLKFW